MGAVLRNRFRRFLESPYHNTNPQFVQLLDLIDESLRSGIDLTKETVISAIWERDPPNDAQLRRFMSQFLKLGLEFISVDFQKSNAIEFQLALAKGVLEHSLKPVESTAIRSLEKALERSPDRSATWYFYKAEASKLMYRSEELELKRIERRTKSLEIINELTYNLDVSFVAEKLRFLAISLTWKKLLSQDVIFDFEEVILEAAQRSQYVGIPAIEIYYQIYLTETNDDDVKNYYRLKSLVNDHILEFPEHQRKEIIDASINYSLKRVNTGDTDFLDELFESYDNGLKFETLFSEGVMTPWTYKNIISVGLRLKKFKWIENFIEDYSQRLPEEFQDSSEVLAIAQLAFYRKRFSEVLPLLQQVEFKEFSYNTAVKSLLLASYYELDEHDLLHNHAESFKKYLRRHKQLSSARKSHFNNLIRFTLDLVRPHSKEKLNEIKSKIEETKGLASKSWLLEKVDELLGVPTTSSKQ